MFLDLESLIGSSVIATDGEIGSVRNFLFDDEFWRIRYLVVDVGSWLKRRNVILPIAAVKQPEWAQKAFHVHLTKEQVGDSPDVDTEKPVSRQQEIATEEYWGKLAYWVSTQWAGGAPIPTGREYPVHTKGDSHLRSVLGLMDYEVLTTNAVMGCLKGFVLDEESWHLGYLNVESGDWLLRRWVLIPTREVKSVSWANRRVYLLHTREEMQGPSIEKKR